MARGQAYKPGRDDKKDSISTSYAGADDRLEAVRRCAPGGRAPLPGDLVRTMA
jgi:hypothetical protein